MLHVWFGGVAVSAQEVRSKKLTRNVAQFPKVARNPHILHLSLRSKGPTGFGVKGKAEALLWIE